MENKRGFGTRYSRVLTSGFESAEQLAAAAVDIIDQRLTSAFTGGHLDTTYGLHLLRNGHKKGTDKLI